MRTNKLVIEINQSIQVVFDFAVDPTNTPKWVKSVLEEKRSDENTKIGTIYYQKILGKNSASKQTSLVVTGFVKNRYLAFHAVNESYCCYYFFESAGTRTKLTYLEDAGPEKELEAPLTMDSINLFKSLVEKKP